MGLSTRKWVLVTALAVAVLMGLTAMVVVLVMDEDDLNVQVVQGNGGSGATDESGGEVPVGEGDNATTGDNGSGGATSNTEKSLYDKNTYGIPVSA